MYMCMILGVMFALSGGTHLAFNKGAGNEVKIWTILLFTLGLIVASSSATWLYGNFQETEETMDSKEVLETYLTNYYDGNSPNLITVVELNEKNTYEVKFLNNRKDKIQLELKNSEVTGIEVIDSSENLKKPS